MANQSALQTDFVVNYGDRKFVYKINSSSDIIVILGPSGYGKSTFIDSILGVKKVSGFIKFGHIWFSSQEHVNVPTERRSIGWVPQSHLLFPHLTIEENLYFGVKDKDSFSDVIAELVASFQLEAILKKRPQNISGGEAQRVAIGRALISTLDFPDGGILLLDEPYASLDAQLCAKISRFVFKWCSKFDIKPIFSVHEIDRIGVWKELKNTSISPYSLEKTQGGIQTVLVTLPSQEKNV